MPAASTWWLKRQIAAKRNRLRRSRNDSYFSSIRDVESDRTAATVGEHAGLAPPLMERPTTFHGNLDLMFELTALALQHDSTRVVSIELPAGGLPIILGGEQLSGYHGQSHHGKDPEVVDELVKIEQMHTRSLSKFLSP